MPSSVKDFFKSNAMGLLAAGVGPQFHDNAKKQKQDIGIRIRIRKKVYNAIFYPYVSI